MKSFSQTKKLSKSVQLGFTKMFNMQRSFSTSLDAELLNLNPKSSYNNKTVFLDFQSTTPVDPRVLDAMMPYNTEFYGNPHSKSHVYGWNAEDAIEKAREVNYLNLKK
jgi:selenocysteine lyase/cysteine desulfurase